MGLVHTPRTIMSIAKGLIKRRSAGPEASLIGLDPLKPHVYHARAGLFDVDYLGHLNNAAYLSHAELARWELTAYNGLLQSLVKNNVNFLVAGATVRYRREIRPIFRHFIIDTTIAGLDPKNIWIVHNFRYPVEGHNRIRAQMIVRGVAVKGRTVLNPREFFQDTVGIDSDALEKIDMTSDSAEIDATVEAMFEKYSEMEEVLRDATAADDKTHEGL